MGMEQLIADRVGFSSQQKPPQVAESHGGGERRTGRETGLTPDFDRLANCAQEPDARRWSGLSSRRFKRVGDNALHPGQANTRALIMADILRRPGSLAPAVPVHAAGAQEGAARFAENILGLGLVAGELGQGSVLL